MAKDTISIEERWDSPEIQVGFFGEAGGATRTYIITGTNDYNEATLAFIDFIPDFLRKYRLKDTNITRLSKTAWEAVASYGSVSSDDNGSDREQWPASTFQFEISGTQQKFLHSFRTIGVYSPPGRRAPYFGGLMRCIQVFAGRAT